MRMCTTHKGVKCRVTWDEPERNGIHLGNAESKSSTTRVGRPRERGEMCVHGPNVVEEGH